MPYWINIEPHRITESAAKYRPFEDFREVCWQAQILRRRGHIVTITTTDGREIDQTDELRQLRDMKVEIFP